MLGQSAGVFRPHHPGPVSGNDVMVIDCTGEAFLTCDKHNSALQRWIISEAFDQIDPEWRPSGSVRCRGQRHNGGGRGWADGQRAGEWLGTGAPVARRLHLLGVCPWEGSRAHFAFPHQFLFQHLPSKVDGRCWRLDPARARARTTPGRLSLRRQQG